jgi:hypothetical protein
MFDDPHSARVRELFSDQFEADGGGFLYRKGMKGAAIRITEVERDIFVSDFNRRLRYATWSILPAMLLLIVLLFLLVPDVDSPAAQVGIYAGLSLVLAPFFVIYYRAWNAPARELERRPLAGGARTREEVRQLMFAKMTYGQLGLAAAGGVLLVWKVSLKHDVLHGWGVLWLVFAGLLIAVAAIQACRKWLFERGSA